MTQATTTNARNSAHGPIEEAERVRDELRAALHAAGIVLPSLQVDAAAYADEYPRPLVELGRCNMQTARRLTVALTGDRDSSPHRAHP
ncbi:hypothetical protein [Streptomyces odontomachi]|uniref:hypothetical protein n=1 Tax=Streptomyces odontomachi TaxID=2944940 RepID=UPI00210E4039|nr:hypothetical protein [Streptomyces sp. ODS25]